MPEGSFDNPQGTVTPLQEHNRRTVIKAAVAASITAPVLGEIAREKEGVVDTSHGTFFPMYEQHTGTDVMEVELPENINGFFREVEFGTISQLFEAAPIDIIYGHAVDRQNGSEFNIIPEHVLSVASREQIPLIFGDVQIPEQLLLHSNETAMGGALATGTAFADRLLTQIAPEKYTRRKLLRMAGLTPAAYLMSNSANDVLQKVYQTTQNEAVRTLARQFESLQSSIHPEDMQVFFRNLVMADKMLTAAAHLEEKNGKKPRIAFEVGAAHQGIENFLHAGREVCRRLIALYPKSTLEEVVKLNNGIEDFSSLRIITTSGDEKTLYQDQSRIHSEKVTDTALRDTVQLKLQY